jgi:hypothetical protein
MLFGRCFEKALESYFCGDDCSTALHREWGAYRDTPFAYKKGESWDRLLHQGVHLLECFARDNRIRIPRPPENLQLKVVRDLPAANQFVAYIDAVGELDGTRCLMDWKATTSRYPEAPTGLLTLDPQLICYSWMTGISDVALVVFIRKHQPEIQYLKTSISEDQRRELIVLWQRRSAKSRPRSSLLTAGSAFPRTVARAAHISGSASMTKP